MKNIKTLPIILILVLSGCNRLEKDWKAAQEQDTVQAYEDFLLRHSEGPLAEKAQERAAELDWKAASQENTGAALDMFVKKWPKNGKNAEAKQRSSFLKESAEVARVIQLTTLEWFFFFPDQLTTGIEITTGEDGKHIKVGEINLNINNKELLKQSRAWNLSHTLFKEVREGITVKNGRIIQLVEIGGVSYGKDPQTPEVIFKRVKGTEFKRLGEGVGFEFKEEWGSPFTVTGNGLPVVEFRSGQIVLARGDVYMSEGMQARIKGEGTITEDGRFVIVPNESLNFIYTFRSGGWKKEESA